MKIWNSQASQEYSLPTWISEGFSSTNYTTFTNLLCESAKILHTASPRKHKRGSGSAYFKETENDGNHSLCVNVRELWQRENGKLQEVQVVQEQQSPQMPFQEFVLLPTGKYVQHWICIWSRTRPKTFVGQMSRDQAILQPLRAYTAFISQVAHIQSCSRTVKQDMEGFCTKSPKETSRGKYTYSTHSVSDNTMLLRAQIVENELKMDTSLV